MAKREHEPDDELLGEAFVIDDGGDDESATITCPSCQREVYEDAAVCPYCHEIILAPTGYPTWVVWVAVLLLAVIAATWLIG